MKQLAYPYYRVSTKRQGRSGLGLLAQKAAVEAYAQANHLFLGKAYIEVEKGRRNNRPGLARALKTCRANSALLLIAKLDRLSRNVAFIAALMESDIEFIAVDNPQATKLMLHMLAAFAQYEAEQGSLRTKAALQAAKDKGVELGWFGKHVLAERNRQKSAAFGMLMKLVFRRLRKEGFVTVRAITEELNKRKVPTYFNQQTHWHIATVHKIIKSH